MKRVLVLRAAGTNCDEETAHAFELAGATADTLHVGTLVRGERRLADYDILAIPGGFSYGDDLGAGTVLAGQLSNRLRADLDDFVGAGKLVIGICNGFQVLVRLGLLPGWTDDPRPVSLVVNECGRFEDRWVRLRVESQACPFLVGAAGGPARRGDLLRLPVAHKEGRFVVRDEGVLERLRAGGQIAVTYAGGDGEPTSEFPANPNGSVGSIAGITNPAGNVLGLMPHPERFVRFEHDPQWTRRAAVGEVPQDRARAGDGYRFFDLAVRS